VNALYRLWIRRLNLTFLHEWYVHNRLFKAYNEVKFKKTVDTNNAKSEVRFKQLIRDL
jgi:hypothetical protein